MIYLFVLIAGAFMGAILLLSIGIPVVILRYVQWLPLDRRVWWTLSAFVAVRSIYRIALGENAYEVPTSTEGLVTFNAFLWGGYASICSLWLAGLVGLSWWDNKNASEPISKLAWPIAAVVCLAGAVLTIDNSKAKMQHLAADRAQIVNAVKSGDLKVLAALVEQGERLNQPFRELGDREPFEFAIDQEDLPMVRFFMMLDEEERPDLSVWMSNILATGNKEVLDLLFDAGGRTPEFLGRVINVAVSTDARFGFEYALSLGGDPNHMYSYTALMIAAKRNRVDYAETLLEAGAEINTIHESSWGNTRKTALAFAAEKGHAEMVRCLLGHWADPNIQDEHGNTPAELARTNGHLEIARVLEEPQRFATPGSLP